MTQLDLQMARITQAIKDGLPAVQFVEEANRLAEEKARLQVMLEASMAAPEPMPKLITQSDVQRKLEALDRMLDSGQPHERRALLRKNIKQIGYNADTDELIMWPLKPATISNYLVETVGIEPTSAKI